MKIVISQIEMIEARIKRMEEDLKYADGGAYSQDKERIRQAREELVQWLKVKQQLDELESLKSQPVSGGCVVGGTGISASIRGAFAEVVGGSMDERAAFDEWFCLLQGYKPGTDTTMLDAAFLSWKAWKARAALAQSERVPNGWRLVPVELLERIETWVTDDCEALRELQAILEAKDE